MTGISRKRSDGVRSCVDALYIDASYVDQVFGEQTYQSRNVIALDESTLVIHKDTTVNHCTET